ncbi:MAG: hypothetical protein ACXWT1_05645 [Methylobacter sp.]
MNILLDNDNWDMRYASVEQFVSDQMEIDDDIEGQEFELVSVSVSVVTRYQIKDGKPVAVSIAFPTGLED